MAQDLAKHLTWDKATEVVIDSDFGLLKLSRYQGRLGRLEYESENFKKLTGQAPHRLSDFCTSCT
jgi:hypothetical protein